MEAPSSISTVELWEGQRFYERVDWDIEDFACMERNQNPIFDALEQQIQEYDAGEN